jgi:tyrosyl-tRNA synthetase
VISDWSQISKSELKRLIAQHGIEVNETKIDLEGANGKINDGMIIKIGQRRIVKIAKK